MHFAVGFGRVQAPPPLPGTRLSGAASDWHQILKWRRVLQVHVKGAKKNTDTGCRSLRSAHLRRSARQACSASGGEVTHTAFDVFFSAEEDF